MNTSKLICFSLSKCVHTQIDRIIDVGYLILDGEDVHIVVGVLTYVGYQENC